jgi:hypothetical protein
VNKYDYGNDVCSGGVVLKAFISVDMEGISGIVDGTMVSRSRGDYEKGRALMAQDVNAARGDFCVSWLLWSPGICPGLSW